MSTMHEHEGARSLYDRLLTCVSYKSLRQECQKFVSNCIICQLTKVTTHSNILNNSEHCERENRIFEQVHIDISGHFADIDGFPQLHKISLIDRVSRYDFTKSTFNNPTATDVVGHLRLVFELFHTTPDVVMTDQGTQFMNSEVAGVLTEFHCSQSVTIRPLFFTTLLNRNHLISK